MLKFRTHALALATLAAVRLAAGSTVAPFVYFQF